MFEDEPHAEGAAAVAAAREALQALCQELNLDEGSAAEALDDFTAIRGNYSLEVSGGRWAAAPTLARPHPRPAPAPAYRAVGAPPPMRVSEEYEQGRVGVARPTHPLVLRRESEDRKGSRWVLSPALLRGSLGSKTLKFDFCAPPSAPNGTVLPLYRSDLIQW